MCGGRGTAIIGGRVRPAVEWKRSITRNKKESRSMSKLLFVSLMSVAMVGAVAAQGAPGAAPSAPAVELKVGDKAPDFTLPGTDGKTHKLSEYKGKSVVLAWYPAAF